METLFWLSAWIIGLGTLACFRLALQTNSIAILGGLIVTTLFADISWLLIISFWLFLGGALVVLNHPDLRKKWVMNPLFNAVKKSLPPLSDTEQVAIDAGTVGWDAELFSGHPRWEKLTTVKKPTLTEEEQAFLDGPVEVLCSMVKDWEITNQAYDLSPDTWAFLKREGFFGLIIPKEFGGKDFSAFAHSEILTKIAGRSLTLASTVSVPNSLGPAELIWHYGTEEQKQYYLPRLAEGLEIPCFALTGPEAGSDATAMTDTGIVCHGTYNGKETIGVRLNWNKRYITLAPIATLLGLAFKLYDPDHLLGDQEDLGITCALVPTNLPGITIGQRHMPFVPFQNGPTQGHDVFISMDALIGGKAMIGQGWRMLVERLSIGRGISLPSTSCGGAKMAGLTAGAYARIRRQFKTPLAEFEGIQEALGRIGGLIYLSEGARTLTTRFIDQGEKPSVLGAIIKCHLTDSGRTIARDAMDIHAGKGLMLGPKNYLAQGYQGVPIGITVEGANILTRSMIIFGQGGIRCHPFILKELHAIEKNQFDTFEKLIGEHTQHTLANLAGSFLHGLTFGHLSHSPVKGKEAIYFKQINRASMAFALVSDICMAMLGGRLKFKEGLSGRLGDLLSYLYLATASLKHYQDQGRMPSDWPLLAWSCQYCLSQFWRAMTELLQNFPNRVAAILLRIAVMPFGSGVKPPSDNLNREISKLLSTENDARSRLMGGCYFDKHPQDEINILMQAFEATLATTDVYSKVLKAQKQGHIPQGSLQSSIQAALKAQILNDLEAKQLSDAHALVLRAIAVDDFAPNAFARKHESMVSNHSALRNTPSQHGKGHSTTLSN